MSAPENEKGAQSPSPDATSGPERAEEALFLAYDANTPAPTNEDRASTPKHDANTSGHELQEENSYRSLDGNASAPGKEKQGPFPTHIHINDPEQAEEAATHPERAEKVASEAQDTKEDASQEQDSKEDAHQEQDAKEDASQAHDANASAPTDEKRAPSTTHDASMSGRDSQQTTLHPSHDMNLPAPTNEEKASAAEATHNHEEETQSQSYEETTSRPGSDRIVRTDESQHIHYIEGSSKRVLPWWNPNSRRYAVDSESGQSSGNEWEWWSRENRKGRHVLLLNQGQAQSSRARTTRLLRAFVHMATIIAWWDVSWWVGVTFSFGSACSITAGVLQWLQVAYPDKTYAVNIQTVAGVLSFIRGWLFLAGGLLLVVEAVNANQTDCFGWALKEAMSDNDDNDNVNLGEPDEEKGNGLQKTSSGYQPDRRNCTHIHNPSRLKHKILHTKKFQIDAAPTPSSPSSPWKWWPTWRDLKYHYSREIGFIANFTLFIGTAVFWITNLLSIPGLYDILPQGVLYGLYYSTFLIGALCFLAASVLYVLEVQRDWWQPMPRMVGWWVGMTNLVGSVGWVYSAALGYCSASWCSYQSQLALIWAPAVYFIGSVLLVYEAVEKWPVHSEQ